MIVTITFLREILHGPNNERLSIGKNFAAADRLTGAGESAAAPAGTVIARVATNTAISLDGYGAGSDDFLPAGSVEWFPCQEGQTFTVADETP